MQAATAWAVSVRAAGNIGVAMIGPRLRILSFIRFSSARFASIGSQRGRVCQTGQHGLRAVRAAHQRGGSHARKAHGEGCCLPVVKFVRGQMPRHRHVRARGRKILAKCQKTAAVRQQIGQGEANFAPCTP